MTGRNSMRIIWCGMAFLKSESVPKAQAIFALIHGSMISSWIKRDPADLMIAALRGIIGER